jgi:two-component system CheB/CheR fusion protein
MTGVRSHEEHLEGALEAADMAWWEIEFPSGALNFSENKTKMLGYDKKDFYHYTKFTELLHPDDFDQAMDAMKDHMTGKKDVYETKYRIKASDGSYRTFFDKGRIVERYDGGYTVAGIVMDITELELSTITE